jgi:GNAT superfamily N-acetyltransferase
MATTEARAIFRGTMTTPTILQMETACLNAWPALKSASDGAWLWRFGKGFGKRANSVQSLDVADDGDAEARLAAMVKLSAEHGIDPVFRVTPLAGPGIVAALDAAGWQSFEESLVLSMPLSRALVPVPYAVKYFEPTDAEWLHQQSEMSLYGEQVRQTLGEIVSHVAGKARGIIVYDEAEQPVAAAMASVAFGLAVYLNVVAAKAERGKGYGRAAMTAALNWTRQAKASHGVIQVLNDNEVALSLYASLGFVEQYRYRYYKPAGSDTR